jgi:superoxide oxidase
MGEYIVGTLKRYWPELDRIGDSRKKVGKRIAAAASHSRATIVAHWGTVLAILVSVAAIYLRDFVEDKPLRQFLLELHRQLGLLVLIAVPIRIAVRYWLGFGNHAGPMSAVLRWAAAACHHVLYAGLVILPLLGWAATSAHHVSLKFLGLVALPGLAAADADVADALTDYHVWGSYALAAIIVVHALAALWHHYFLRDAVLTAMLGGRGARRRAP